MPSLPGSGDPVRIVDIGREDLVGMTDREVVANLGPPNGRKPGRYWASGGGLAVERGPDGVLREVALFGPRPVSIEPGVHHSVWTYRGVRTAGSRAPAEVWLLYLVPTRGSRAQVVETAAHPAGAVF